MRTFNVYTFSGTPKSWINTIFTRRCRYVIAVIGPDGMYRSNVGKPLSVL